jgi:hypothetical protein
LVEEVLLVQQIISQPPLNDQKVSSSNSSNLVLLKITNPADPAKPLIVALDLDQSMLYFAADNPSSSAPGQAVVGVSLSPQAPAATPGASSFSGSDLNSSFQEGETQSVQNTAEKLGLQGAGLSEVPSTEQLKVLLKAVAAWMRNQAPKVP